MTKETALDILIWHNCAGPCSCEECKEAKRISEEENEKEKS